jgi:hypothetical protein
MFTQKLLNISWRDKKATPFRVKLHGLKMNEALIKRLLGGIRKYLYESNISQAAVPKVIYPLPSNLKNQMGQGIE